jgi:hypothetical protein
LTPPATTEQARYHNVSLVFLDNNDIHATANQIVDALQHNLVLSVFILFGWPPSDGKTGKADVWWQTRGKL